MRIRQIARSAAFAAGLGALPLSTATAQYYYPPPPYRAPAYYPPPAYYVPPNNPCWFPLFWPVCVAGAMVGTAGVIVTAPFRALAPPPPYYYRYYGYPPPGYRAPGYYQPPAYNAPGSSAPRS